jgi:chromatin structure-remodeling complex subunit RSC1/2
MSKLGNNEPAPYQGSYSSQITPTPHRAQVNSNNSRERTVMGTTGGWTAIGHNVLIEKLPPETSELFILWLQRGRVDGFIYFIFPLAKHFDRDPDTNEVLWFSSPPMNMVQAVKPKHSLKYLHFLAMKRKREKGLEAEGDDEMVLDDETPATQRRRVRPTMTETISSILSDLTSDLEGQG